MTDIFEPRFLLASLHIEAILRSTTVARRRKTLKSMKDGAGLGDAYGATLERIKAQDEEKAGLAMAALTWICHSERPLQVDELCHALAVEIGATNFDPENVPSIGTLLDCCQGLIAVDAEAMTVRLIHYTVQEYLCSHPGLFSKPHSILAETYLTYLNSKRVKDLTPHSLPAHGSMPFLKYSSRYWGTHTNKDLTDHARTLALELLNMYEDQIFVVSLLGQVLQNGYIGGIASPLFSGLHCASFFGIVDLVTVLINAEGYQVEQRDCVGRTPLAWAAENGHEGVIEILLERETIDLNRPDVYGQTPLGSAAIAGYERVVKILLEREEVDPNRPGTVDRTPLLCAAISGHEGVVKLFLGRKDVDPNRPDTDDYTPLLCAAINGHEGVVELLLRREDVDSNRPGADGRTPLLCAAISRHEGVVELFLRREDVDPNRPDTDDQTPLLCAAVNGYEGVVKLLLGREDVDPNRPGADGRTPLLCAAISGHEGVVGLLLRREDVDPNRPDPDGRAPLLHAAAIGHGGVVKLLLEQEHVDPNLPDKHGGTPLSYAAQEGHGLLLQLLQAWTFIQNPNTPLSHQLRRN